jgi:hypothetical protein
MDVARHWPVLTSYDDLSLYAHWKGGRLPTEPELRMFFDVYEVGYEGGANVGFRNWHPVPLSDYSLIQMWFVFKVCVTGQQLDWQRMVAEVQMAVFGSGRVQCLMDTKGLCLLIYSGGESRLCHTGSWNAFLR